MEQHFRKLKTGDILITTTQYPLIQHFGVVVIEGNKTSVYHCIPNRNVTLDTLFDFLTHRDLVDIRTTNTPSIRIHKRFKSIQQRKYNAISFNCIHLAEFLTSEDL